MCEISYEGKPPSEWKPITDKLLSEYPLDGTDIKKMVLSAWDKLWKTKIGGTIPIEDIGLKASSIGEIFQKLFSNELDIRYPDSWRTDKEKKDKDFVYIKDPKFSTEMKTSGQLQLKIFGNRSYNQKKSKEDKSKSGYYITINYYEKTINLIRLGWIDQDDWIPQKSPTGQAAGLSNDVYNHKLIIISGNYRLRSPIELLKGIGPKTAEKLNAKNFYTFDDILRYQGEDEQIIKLKTQINILLKSDSNI